MCSVHHGESLGHDHGGVGVGVKQFFVEWRKEDIDCFRVQLLEGLQLLCVECAQGRQRWNSANQLPSKRSRPRNRGGVRDEQRGCHAATHLCTQKSSFHSWSGSDRGGAYLGQSVLVHVVLLHDVLQSKIDLLLELLNLPGLHQPGPIWAGERMFP